MLDLLCLGITGLARVCYGVGRYTVGLHHRMERTRSGRRMYIYSAARVCFSVIVRIRRLLNLEACRHLRDHWLAELQLVVVRFPGDQAKGTAHTNVRNDGFHVSQS